MPEHRFVIANGLRIHQLDFGGEGRPAVLLHGVTGHAWAWMEVVPGLVGLRRVYAIDMRGHGDSQWHPEQDYRTEALAGDVAAVIGGFGPPVDIAGSSWGGLVGLHLAIARPDLVRTVAMIDIPPSFTSSVTDVPPRPESFADHAEAEAFERSKDPNASEAMVQMLAEFGTRPGPGGRLYRKHDPIFLTHWPFRADDRWGDVRSVRRPVLVARASQSSVLEDAAAKRMKAELPDGRLAVVEGSGHQVHLDQPGALAELLVGFWRTD